MAATCTACNKNLSFLERLGGDTCRDCQKRRKEQSLQARQAFPDRLRQAIADGRLDTWEQTDLDQLIETGQLTPAEVRNISLAVYEEAKRQAVGDRVLTQEEYDHLASLQAALQIPDHLIARNLRELARLRLLTEIHDGALPAAAHTSIVLRANETCHFECSAQLIEEKLVSRTLVADSTVRRKERGILSDSTLRSYNVTTMYETQDRQFSATDQGTLTITSHRAVFSGHRETVNIPYDKLHSVAVTGHGVRLGVEGRKTVRILDVDDEEVVAALVGQASQLYHTMSEAMPTRNKRKTKTTAEPDSPWR